MPSKLAPGARCPECGVELEAVVWTELLRNGVHMMDMEFHHKPQGPKCRRKRFCRASMGIIEARQVRAALHGRTN